jgi:hypothetical protein
VDDTLCRILEGRLSGSVGQICLYDNLALKRPLTLLDLKHMLLD